MNTSRSSSSSSRNSNYSKRSGVRGAFSPSGKSPAKWPFPAKRGGDKPKLSKGSMAADVCLVALWGASIPCVMWLGAAGGF